MPNIRVISNSLAKKHSNSYSHPESAQRIEIIEEWLSINPDNHITHEILSDFATREEILTVHSDDYYRLIEKTQGYGGYFLFTMDTGANSYTFDAARQAVAIGKSAILESDHRTSIFALVRPPGHHATRSAAQGFCIFNNISIATEIALQQKKYQRIAIIDFDNHFGNGTAYNHEENPDILYISTHASPKICYPGSGHYDEIGRGDGKGFNIPIPLWYRANEIDIQFVFEQLILPIIHQFKPEFLAISAGFDAYEKDPLGVLGVTKEGFSIIGAYIQLISQELNIPLANFLEGGYNIQDLPDLIFSYITPLIYPDQDYLKNKISNEPLSQTISTINRSKKLLSEYWEL